MNIIAALAIAPLCLVVGCASSMSRGTNAAAEPSTGVALELETGDAVSPSFPKRIAAAETPRSANRLAKRVVAELGGDARAALKLCVGADGRVSEAAVARSSGIAELDQAFTTEARTWRYEPLAAHDATVCEQVDIAYHVR